MAKSALSIEPLGQHHDRTAFSCGVEVLDRYLRDIAWNDLRRHVAAVWVLRSEPSFNVIGYYTLSATSVDLRELPPDMARRLPRYPALPAVLLGRLAVDRRHQGKGLGELLLIDALIRARSHAHQIAAMSVLVDPLDDRAAAFYARYGFQPLNDAGERMFIAMRTLEGL